MPQEVRCAAFVSLVALRVTAPTDDAERNNRSWAADNGNGTYSNPLFWDEFSDPEMIGVGLDS